MVFARLFYGFSPGFAELLVFFFFFFNLALLR